METKPFIIAEIGGNHGGEVALGQEMIRAAAQAGATAVKFQAYDSPELLSPQSPYFPELTQEELKKEGWPILAQEAKECGLTFFFSVFGDFGLNLAQELQGPIIKISSSDIDNLELIKKATEISPEIILSVGGATLEEIGEAVQVLKAGAKKFTLLYCLPLYPAPPETYDLKMIPLLKKGFNCAVGLSDHSLGLGLALGALALGATMVEKHFTINKNLPGGDNSISLNPEEFSLLTKEAQGLWQSLYFPQFPPELVETLKVIRRQTVAAHNLKKGQIITPQDLAYKRSPTTGLGIKESGSLIGKILKKDFRKDELLTLNS